MELGQQTRWGFAALTGGKALKDGHGALESINIGLWSAWWYKNLTLSIFFLVGLSLMSAGGNYVWAGPLQLAVNLLVFGVTYVSLADIAGWQHRGWYRVWAPVQHHCFPNVARMWWYALIFFPGWLLIIIRFATYVPGAK